MTSHEGQRARPVTRRQHEVLRLVAEGLSNEEIAFRLQITASGVKKHLEALTRRYNVTGRTALVRAAIEAGDLAITIRTNDGKVGDT
ncbi:MAG TPA: helix-turn-helix transcriptional regulator [Candidatus Limnocylindria bacterium]